MNTRLKILLFASALITIASSYFLVGCSTMPQAHFELSQPKLNPLTDNEFELDEDFYFLDSKNKHWKAPQGTITDGASIPEIFQPIIGDQWDPKYRNAAIIHDAYCANRNKGHESYQKDTWEAVHQMFYEASLTLGTDRLKAELMYAGIWLGGPRWGDPKRNLESVPKERLKQELKLCKKFMDEKHPTHEEVYRWMKEREQDLLTGKNPKPWP